MQSPSSLIFLVLLGVWAAYFVQYWVRRRDHVATARSVEQFSEAMRVLERRDPLPRTDLSEPAPRSYAVHPARAARPQVLVKRAVATEPARAGVTERVSAGSAGRDTAADVAASAGPSLSPSSSSSSSTGSPSRPASSAAVPRRPAAGGRRVQPSRRVRGLLLLGAVAELLVIAPLVAVSMLPLWALAPALLAVVWSLLFVRSGARAERALARAHRRRQASHERRRATAPAVSRAAELVTAAAPSGAAVSEARPVEVLENVEVRAAAEPVVTLEAGVPGADPIVAEGVIPAEPAAEVMVPLVDEDDIPLTWDPVPVPRPTYTMKAKATRPEVAPAAVTPDPVPVARDGEREGERDGSGYDERRVAGA